MSAYKHIEQLLNDEAINFGTRTNAYHMKVEALILAAGQSIRMGDKNKLLLPFEKDVIINVVIEEIVRSGVDKITLILGHESSDVMKALYHKNLKVFFNQNYKTGMTSSIATGIKNIDPDTDGVMICLGDMPLIKASQYRELLHIFRQSTRPSIMRPTYEAKVGHPIFIDKAFFNELLLCKEPDGCRIVIMDNEHFFTKIERAESAFFWDIDTAEEYQHLFQR